MIVESDYRGFRIEVVAQFIDGAWNANVRIRRTCGGQGLMRLALVLVLLAACVREPVPGVARANCTLSWNPVSGPVAGYRIYVSAKRGEYGAPVATVPPSRTEWRCSEVGVGQWFMTVTAFDAVGAESPRSEEIIVNVRE